MTKAYASMTQMNNAIKRAAHITTADMNVTIGESFELRGDLEDSITTHDIARDGSYARCGLGIRYEVGETVAHQDESAGTAVIQSFEWNPSNSDTVIRVHTDKGYADIDFLEKVSS
jgi:hypothetical protein